MNAFIATNLKGSGGMGTVSEEFFVKSLGQIFPVNIIDEKKDYINKNNNSDDIFFRYGWRQDVYQDFLNCDILHNVSRHQVQNNIFVMPFDACMLNPKKIKDINLFFSQVWCDSNFTLRQASKAGVKKEKLKLFKLGVNNKNNYKKFVNVDGIFRFVNISGPNMFRVKGLDVLIKSFIEAFVGREDVGLCIKTSNKNNYDVFLREYILLEKKRNKSDFPRIKIITDCIKNKDIFEFLTRFDCYVQPSRSETFGLPLLEAMSVGLPVIASGHGGMLDFLDKNNSILVDGCITKMKKNEWRNNKETTWYEVDKNSLKKGMLDLFNKRVFYQERALNYSKYVRENWSWSDSLKFNMKNIKKLI